MKAYMVRASPHDEEGRDLYVVITDDDSGYEPEDGETAKPLEEWYADVKAEMKTKHGIPVFAVVLNFFDLGISMQAEEGGSNED